MSGCCCLATPCIGAGSVCMRPVFFWKLPHGFESHDQTLCFILIHKWILCRLFWPNSQLPVRDLHASPCCFSAVLSQIAGYVNQPMVDVSILQRSLAILESMVLNSHSLYHRVAQEITVGQLIGHLQVWAHTHAQGLFALWSWSCGGVEEWGNEGCHLIHGTIKAVSTGCLEASTWTPALVLYCSICLYFSTNPAKGPKPLVYCISHFCYVYSFALSLLVPIK